MTVKELKEAIANLPDEGEVFVERIEDKYFNNHGWTTKKMPGEQYMTGVKWNEDIDSGKYLDKEEYPNIIPEKHLKKIPPEQLETLKSEFIRTWCCIGYDKTNLYITSHY